jgi:hypothetical protein
MQRIVRAWGRVGPAAKLRMSQPVIFFDELFVEISVNLGDEGGVRGGGGVHLHCDRYHASDRLKSNYWDLCWVYPSPGSCNFGIVA